MKTTDLELNYSKKIEALFELKNENSVKEYIAKNNFSDKDIEELIEFATDTNFDSYMAVSYAVYALAHLKAVQSIYPLLEHIDSVDGLCNFHYETIIEFLKIFGKESIETIENYIFDNANSKDLISIFEAFEYMVQNDPSALNRIEEVMVRYLKNDITNKASLAFAIYELVELTREKHIDLIRQTYKTKEVDPGVCGDIEDIEIELGLRDKRETVGVKSEIQEIFEKYDIGNVEDFKKLLEAQSTGDEPTEAETFFGISKEKKKPKVGRNDPCPCGSGKKYKKCCFNK